MTDDMTPVGSGSRPGVAGPPPGVHQPPEPDDAPTWRAWTSHGWRIDGVPQVGDVPTTLRECGGPGTWVNGQCVTCLDDAITARSLYDAWIAARAAAGRFVSDPDESLPWPADDGVAIRAAIGEAATGEAPTAGITILGKNVRHAITAAQLETFPPPPTGVDTVTFATDEFASLCPITEQPDTSSVTIRYSPSERCIESKSLKLYLWSFRDRGVFVEGIAAEIADAVMAATDAVHVYVRVDQAIRGGIATSAEAVRPLPPRALTGVMPC